MKKKKAKTKSKTQIGRERYWATLKASLARQARYLEIKRDRRDAMWKRAKL